MQKVFVWFFFPVMHKLLASARYKMLWGVMVVLGAHRITSKACLTCLMHVF